METAISLLSIIMSTFALFASLGCIAVVIGLRNSTHKIEFRPVPMPDQNMNFRSEDVEDIEGASVELEKKLKAEVKLNPVMHGFSRMYEEQ